VKELIYIVEDDNNIRELVSVALTAHSYTIKAFACAEDALSESKRNVPDLIILDIMLPGIDGLTALKKLRSEKDTCNVLVLLLTAKSAEIDKVIGLESGADDYLAKPFGVMELAARVKALFRRNAHSSDEKETVLSSGGIVIDTSTREVSVNGESTVLTLKEYELLKILMENKNRVVTREELLDKLWGYDFVSETRTLDMHIRTLRQKLGDYADSPRYIRTVRGVGYHFVS
jgi:two-component system alkaline phosphatase synthesis response regulator PhoP